MRQSIQLLVLSVTAAAAFEAERFVTGGGVVATAGGRSAGIARSKGVVGMSTPVTVVGTDVVTAGGAIPADSLIEVGADGKAIVQDEGIAVARAAPGASAAADGDPIEVVLIVN